jgi:hypothetical protein
MFSAMFAAVLKVDAVTVGARASEFLGFLVAGKAAGEWGGRLRFRPLGDITTTLAVRLRVRKAGESWGPTSG